MRRGKEVGAVTAVQLPGTDARPGTAVGIAEHLMGGGYIRIDGTGDEVAEVVEAEPGVVNLRVHRDEPPRAEA
jgi:hypothetical protein